MYTRKPVVSARSATSSARATGQSSLTSDPLLATELSSFTAPPIRASCTPGTKDTVALFHHYVDEGKIVQGGQPEKSSFGGFGGGDFGGGGAGGSWDEPAKQSGRAIEIQFMAFIPSRLGKPFRQTKAGKKNGFKNQKAFDAEVAAVPGYWGAEPGNVFNDYCFRTDDRDFGGGSHRLISHASINTSDLGHWTKENPFGGEAGPSERAWVDSGFFTNEGHVKRERKQAVAKSTSKPVTNNNDSSTFQASAAAAYPFVKLSPDIDLSGNWKLTKLDPAGSKVLVELNGEHNDFPCYEVLVNGTNLYRFNTSGTGPNLWNLGMASTKFKASGTF